MSCELHMPLKCKGDVDSHRIIPTSGKNFQMEMKSKTLLKIKKKEKQSECPKTAATKTNQKKNMQHAAEGEGR